jgi:hypothetical protein
MQVWVASSLVRHFPASRPRRRSSLRLHAARGEQSSFQVAFRTGPEHAKVTAEVAAPEGAEVTLRRVGYVPMPHHNTETQEQELDGVGHIPGYVPDPLLPL